MENTFDPWDSVLKGQRSADSLHQAQLQGIDLRERLALKRAAGQLGSQNYFAGYEGVPGAERPAALSEAWQNADPAEAAKLEAMYAEPFKLKRAAELVGTAEAAKDAAKFGAFGTFIDDRIKKSGINTNAMADKLRGEGGQPGSGVSPVDPSVQDLNGLSGIKQSYGFASGSPTFNMEVMPDITRAQGVADITSKRAATQQATQTFQQNQLDQAHTNLRNTVENYQKALTADSEKKGNPVLTEELRQSILQQRSALDALARGTTPPAAPSAPNVSASPSAPSTVQGAVQSLDRNMGQQTQQLSAIAQAVPSGRLTPYQESLVDMKDREGQATDARASIDQAIKDSQSATQALPYAKEMKRLMYTDEKGYPSLDGIWGTDNVLALSPSNARIIDLNKIIGSLLIKEGQSRLNDTIVERKMQAAKVAGIYSDPQLNRMKASLLLSVFELKQKYPGFLEQWKREHQHTLQGAETAWEDYAQNNLRHTYTRDARGTVTGHTRSDVMDPKEWLTLRNEGKLQVVPPAQDGGAPQFMVRQPNGNYKARR